jgi:hypothetical protein
MAYCGIGTAPVGKEIGTAEECAEMNQVRRYGLVKIGLSVLNNGKNLQLLKKENNKLDRLKMATKKMVRTYLILRDILSNPKTQGKKKEETQEKLRQLVKDKDVLKKKLEIRKGVIKNLEDAIEQRRRLIKIGDKMVADNLKKKEAPKKKKEAPKKKNSKKVVQKKKAKKN